MDATALILGLLYDAGQEGLACERLCDQLSLRPRQLDAAIEEISRRGQPVQSDRDGRLRLAEPIRLNPFLIERGLDTRRLGCSVICFEQVDSTNDTAADAARTGHSDGLVIAAESQRAGRGRLGRTWVSPPRANLLFSVVLVDAADALAREAVTIAAGLSIAEGIAEAVGLDCDLKWPNDVLLGGAKLAGVLVERRHLPAGDCYIVGMGVNVGAAPSARQLGRAATCLSDHVELADRIRLLRTILRRLDGWVWRIASDRAGDLRGAWQLRCGMLHQRVRIRWAGDVYEGIVLDVDPMEGLVLAQDQGPRVMIPGTEATLLD